MTVFILGAGFSKGYNPKVVPLISEFLDIAEKKKVLKPDTEHKELVNFIEKYLGDYGHVNIETLASFLTADLVPDLSQKYEYREKMYKQLVWIIVHTLGQLYKGPLNKVVQDTFQKFVDKLVENGIDVITFNYDLILDNLLNNTGKWSIVSGYGVKMKLAGISRDLRKEEYQSESKMSYLKLHGSLNWGRSILPHPYNGNEIVTSPSGLKLNQEISEIMPIEGMVSAEGSPGVNKYYETFVIPPILSKERFYTTPLLQNVWYTAKEVIMRSKEIFIIGYSFPPSDFLAEFLFRQSIANPFSESEKKIRVIKKSIDSGYKERVKNIFQKSEFEYIEEDAVKFLESYTK